MATARASASSTDGYDVYISYPRADVTWAGRLAQDLSKLGLRCFMDLDLSAGESWSEALNRALDSSGTLVVLWSPAAQESKGILAEIAGFEALMRQGDRRRRRVIVKCCG